MPHEPCLDFLLPRRRHIITSQIDYLVPPLKRGLVFAVKYVKRRVPRWQLPGATAFRTALSVGAGGTARAALAAWLVAHHLRRQSAA